MNDERPIEKLLRRFAQKRRKEAGAPAELHPANRRTLQAEVARQFPKAPPREHWWTGFSLLLNRKLAYAVAVLAVVGISALLLRAPRNESMGLAKLDAQKQVEPSTPPGEVAGDLSAIRPVAEERKDEFTTGPQVASAPPSVAQESVREVRDRAEPPADFYKSDDRTAPTPTSLGPSSSAGNTEAERTALRQQQVRDSVTRYNIQSGERAPATAEANIASRAAPARPADAASGTVSPSFRQAGGFGGGGGIPAATRVVQSYYQSTLEAGDLRVGPAPGGTAPILANFVVEQTGDQIRVTDSDASTYQGRLEMAAEPAARPPIAAGGRGGRSVAPAPTSTLAAPTAEAEIDAARNYSFRLSGTNRTLNQPVTIVGNFVALTNAAVGGKAEAAFAEKAKLATEAQPPLPRLEDSAIRGRVRIGSGPEVELNALPLRR